VGNFGASSKPRTDHLSKVDLQPNAYDMIQPKPDVKSDVIFECQVNAAFPGVQELTSITPPESLSFCITDIGAEYEEAARDWLGHPDRKYTKLELLTSNYSQVLSTLDWAYSRMAGKEPKE
jgi:hypothetical protein